MNKRKLIENVVDINKLNMFDNNLYIIKRFSFNTSIDSAIFLRYKM